MLPVQSDALDRDQHTRPGDGSLAEWWEILLRERDASPPMVIEALRQFVHRAIRHGIGGRRECDSAFLEDVTQEATLRLLKSLHTFRGDSRFTTWATTVAVRVAFTELRHARWKEISLDQLLSAQDGKSASKYEPASNDDKADQDGDREALVSSLRQVMERHLSERQLTAITAELAGMPMQQLADKLQTNPNALYKLLHDARKKLKKGLAEIGITEQDVRISLDM